MLNYHFTSKLLTTENLLKELQISISELDFWKTQWRKLHHKQSGSALPYLDWKKVSDDPCWNMGLRLIGKKALYDPIIFLEWLNNNKLKNKPREQRDLHLVAFVNRNSSTRHNT
tara:strand:- start:913 stop:1254 length:342 start_codon:yes stop_codon:yes gene_type:complete